MCCYDVGLEAIGLWGGMVYLDVRSFIVREERMWLGWVGKRRWRGGVGRYGAFKGGNKQALRT